jgi:hypothetical protein
MKSCFLALLTLPAMLTSLSAFGSSQWCEAIPEQHSSKWAEHAFDNGDVIILGLVHSVEYIDPPVGEEPPTDRKASSMKELLEMIEKGQKLHLQRFDHIITFRVETAWKGASTGKFITAKIFLGERLRTNPIRLGERYLVVGKDADNSSVWIRSRCSDAVKKEWAPRLVSKLDDIFITRQAAGYVPD